MATTTVAKGIEHEVLQLSMSIFYVNQKIPNPFFRFSSKTQSHLQKKVAIKEGFELLTFISFQHFSTLAPTILNLSNPQFIF